MKAVEVARVTDGHNAAVITVGGVLEKDGATLDLIDWKELNPVPQKVRIESVVFAVQEKAGLLLWWKVDGGKKSFILPLESRGKLDFEGLQGIHAPPDSTGICMTSFGVTSPKYIRLSIDLTKQF